MFPGTAYCTAFNDAEQLAELDSILRSAPYDAPPVAPVLYIKGGHCLVPSGSVVAIPEPYWRLSIGASVAVQRTVTGFDTVRPAIDLAIPHESFFRPAIGEVARDGFLVLGDAQPWPDNFDSAEIVTEIQRTIVHRWSLTQLVRPVIALLADISDFMSLLPGDLLVIGTPGNAPLARHGDHVRVTVTGFTPVSLTMAEAFSASGQEP